MISVDITLNLVRQQDIDQVAFFCRFVNRQWFETVLFCQFVIRRARTFRYHNIAAAVSQVLRLSVALRAIP